MARIPRSDDIIRFEDQGKTVIEGDPELEVSKCLSARKRWNRRGRKLI